MESTFRLLSLDSEPSIRQPGACMKRMSPTHRRLISAPAVWSTCSALRGIPGIVWLKWGIYPSPAPQELSRPKLPSSSSRVRGRGGPSVTYHARKLQSCLRTSFRLSSFYSLHCFPSSIFQQLLVDGSQETPSKPPSESITSWRRETLVVPERQARGTPETRRSSGHSSRSTSPASRTKLTATVCLFRAPESSSHRKLALSLSLCLVVQQGSPSC